MYYQKTGVDYLINLQNFIMIKGLKAKIKSRLLVFLQQESEKNSRDESNISEVQIGEQSKIHIPTKISGGKNISLGNKSSIGHDSWIATFESYGSQNFQPKINIGNTVSIGNFACITAIDAIEIHDGCLISEHVYISDHYHGTDPSANIPPINQPLFSKGKVILGENTFVGYRVSILSGVKIGKNCVVGAHSVVTRNVPDNCMVAGIPAKIIKQYNFQSNSWESTNHEINNK